MVPYGLAIFGIEGSDKRETRGKLGITLGTVLDLLLTRHHSVCVLFKIPPRETLCRAKTRHNEESHLHRR